MDKREVNGSQLNVEISKSGGRGGGASRGGRYAIVEILCDFEDLVNNFKTQYSNYKNFDYQVIHRG